MWCELNNKPFELISEEYKNNYIKLQWKCLKENCGETFETKWNDIYSGKCCGYCDGKKVGLSNCLITKNPDLIAEWHPIKNGNLTPYDVTAGSGKYVWWKCSECGHEWQARVVDRPRYGCPQCSKSKGEKMISQILDYKGLIKIDQEEYDKLNSFDKAKYIYYIPQKEFDGLVGLKNGLLSYDFFLPDCNLLIEYQGEQHEKYIKGFHKSKKDFEKQLEHDKRKKEYAKNNNINLLEIWYYDFENIEEILEKEVLNFDKSRMVS